MTIGHFLLGLVALESIAGVVLMFKAQRHFDRRLRVPVPTWQSDILCTVDSDHIGLV